MIENKGVEKRHNLLRFIASALKVLAWVALTGSGIIALGVLAAAAGADLPQLREAGLVGFFLFLLYGIGLFIFLYVSGAVIRVFLDVEENIRGMRERSDIATPASAPPVVKPLVPERVVHVPGSAEAASAPELITIGPAPSANPTSGGNESRTP